MENEEKRRLEELEIILNEYNPINQVFESILVLLVLFVALAIGVFVGTFWMIIIVLAICGLVSILIENLGITFNRTSLPLPNLSYKACIAMEALIDIREGRIDQNGIHFVRVGTGKHKKLYKKFISYYPSLKSRKLKKLTSVNIQHKDIYR